MEKEIKKIVKKAYGEIARQSSSCSCCGTISVNKKDRKTRYSEEEIKMAPEAANLALGCGNPVAIASLKEGEVVLDLGCGAGFDCFLAAQKVGKKGRVIGVDMTPEMIHKARENAKKGGYENVEFRFGEIENLPVADNSIDVVMSNCVINLSPHKARVFKEAFRVLRPGGRLIISDIVLIKDLPESVKNNMEAYIGCVAGAVLKDEYLGFIEQAGFQNIKVVNEKPFSASYCYNDSEEISKSIISITVYGDKLKEQPD
jgi:ubiquinone/menaquinone biosynthesis C-methylase UbiE